MIIYFRIFLLERYLEFFLVSSWRVSSLRPEQRSATSFHIYVDDKLLKDSSIQRLFDHPTSERTKLTQNSVL